MKELTNKYVLIPIHANYKQKKSKYIQQLEHYIEVM